MKKLFLLGAISSLASVATAQNISKATYLIRLAFPNASRIDLTVSQYEPIQSSPVATVACQIPIEYFQGTPLAHSWNFTYKSPGLYFDAIFAKMSDDIMLNGKRLTPLRSDENSMPLFMFIYYPTFNEQFLQLGGGLGNDDEQTLFFPLSQVAVNDDGEPLSLPTTASIYTSVWPIADPNVEQPDITFPCNVNYPHDN